jgi:hypothetical protein
MMGWISKMKWRNHSFWNATVIKGIRKALGIKKHCNFILSLPFNDNPASKYLFALHRVRSYPSSPKKVISSGSVSGVKSKSE